MSTARSSPPRRATRSLARTAPLSRPPRAASTSSPTRWPCSRLSWRMPTTSNTARARGAPVARPPPAPPRRPARGPAGQDAGQRIVAGRRHQPLVIGDQPAVAGAERQLARQPRRQRAQIGDLGGGEASRPIGDHGDQAADLVRAGGQGRGDHAEQPGPGGDGGDAGGGRDPRRRRHRRLIGVAAGPGRPRHQAVALAPPERAVVGGEGPRDRRQALGGRLAVAVDDRGRDQAAGPGQLDLGQRHRRRLTDQGQGLGRGRRDHHADRAARHRRRRDLAGRVDVAQDPARARGHLAGQAVGDAGRHQHRGRQKPPGQRGRSPPPGARRSGSRAGRPHPGGRPGRRSPGAARPRSPLYRQPGRRARPAPAVFAQSTPTGRGQRAASAAMPGSSSPWMNSRDAPPPVDTWVT
jgi:hypothetical protein